MTIEQDIYRRAFEKTAGFMDTINGLVGNEGTMNTPLSALGGAALGAMAGKSLGMPGMIGGGLLGGAMGGIGANAINSQNMYQNGADMALMNGMSQGLGMNDETDMAQSQAIGQLADAVNTLAQSQAMQSQTMSDMMMQQQSMMDPAMMGGMPPVDPSMQGGMPPADAGMMPPPPQGNPVQDQIPNNGLGTKQGSFRGSTAFERDVVSRVNQKLAILSRNI